MLIAISWNPLRFICLLPPSLPSVRSTSTRRIGPGFSDNNSCCSNKDLSTAPQWILCLPFFISKFFRQVKETKETTNSQACILINQTSHYHTFSVLVKICLYGNFHINKHVCLTMHHFYSISIVGCICQ